MIRFERNEKFQGTEFGFNVTSSKLVVLSSEYGFIVSSQLDNIRVGLGLLLTLIVITCVFLCKFRRLLLTVEFN